MQWLIDIIVEAVLARFKNIISEWHGTLADIPDGWVLCDGNNGTPDLRYKFIWGAGAEGDIGVSGGFSEHDHNFTSNTHNHDLTMNLTADGLDDGSEIIGTLQGPIATDNEVVHGSTNLATHLPPYYLLAFIMKT